MCEWRQEKSNRILYWREFIDWKHDCSAVSHLSCPFGQQLILTAGQPGQHSVKCKAAHYSLNVNTLRERERENVFFGICCAFLSSRTVLKLAFNSIEYCTTSLFLIGYWFGGFNKQNNLSGYRINWRGDANAHADILQFAIVVSLLYFCFRSLSTSLTVDRFDIGRVLLLLCCWHCE